MALRARDGADARLDDDERVGRVGEAVVLGDDAELHLESDGHPGLSCLGPYGPGMAGTGGRGSIGLPAFGRSAIVASEVAGR